MSDSPRVSRTVGPPRDAGAPGVARRPDASDAVPGHVIGIDVGSQSVDLLTYRHPTADAHALTAAVVAASSGPVIAAGSVVGAAQIGTLAAAGAWGFTIGGAIFEGRLPGGPDVAAQVRTCSPSRPAREAGAGTAPTSTSRMAPD
jgi:hypothetical protein